MANKATSRMKRKKTPAPKPTPLTYPSTTMPRIAARVSKKSEKRIKEFALEADCTVQDLILRGLSQLLENDGLEPLDEMTTRCTLGAPPRRRKST